MWGCDWKKHEARDYFPSKSNDSFSLSPPAPAIAADDLVGFSGDFGSGVGWEDEEEKEVEETGEEAEEEEGEAGEADDGGYIW